jgi:hypothetical protein
MFRVAGGLSLAYIGTASATEFGVSLSCEPTLGDTILPWTSKTGPLWLDAKALHGVGNFFIEICTAMPGPLR